MTERNPAIVVILSLLTLCVYAFYWLYDSTRELARVTRDPRLDPMIDLVLAVVTFGLWGLYAAYRNARVVHEALVARGVAHESKENLVAAFNLGSFFVGMSWVVSLALLQEDYNALARLEPSTSATSAPLPVAY